MHTPIADFIDEYTADAPIRLHMPGHKGRAATGPETLDITEIPGADTLYEADGIIAESEAYAASIFGTGTTLYSTEGSTLAIRAMLYLLCQCSRRRRPLVAAGRNAHGSFYSGAALLGIDVVDIYPGDDGYIALESVRETVDTCRPDAVYLTSPDYEGRIADIGAAADIAHAAGIPLLVDNAHGAYLRFLSPSLHPIDLGADMTADSAHKTLPVLTGGAYLHIAGEAPGAFHECALPAMRLFASTSPSYLILRSLDIANRLIAEGLDRDIRTKAERVRVLKTALSERGFSFIGDEPLKLTIDTALYGWRGDDMALVLANKGIYAEAFSAGELILMFSAFSDEHDFEALEQALSEVERKDKITPPAPGIVRGKRAMDMREAWLSRLERIHPEQALGRILAEPVSHCPPGVPIALPGERVGDELIEACGYLGIGIISVIA